MALYLGSNKLNVNLCNDKLLANYYVSAQSQGKTTNLSTLKINKLTQEQYDEELANGTIDDTALYLTPDDRKSVYQYAKEYGYTGTEEEFEEFFLNLSTINEDVFLDLAIKPTTEKAVCHNIQDSTDYRILDFNMDGKTEQFTTTGKNLLNENAVAPISVNEDGVKRYGWDLGVLPQGTYTLTAYGNYLNSSPISYKIITDGNYSEYSSLYEDGKSVSITLDGTQGLIVYLYQNVTALYDNVTLQLEKGTVSSTYEPFTDGISPNPNYPQDVTNAGVYNEETGRYELTCDVVNKNFFDISKSEGFISVYTGISNAIDIEKGVIKVTNTYTATRTVNMQLGFLKAGNYRLSIKTDSISSIIIKKGTGADAVNLTSFDATLGGKAFILDVDSNVSIETFINAEKTLTYSDIQVEKGTTAATDYEPHQKQSITLSSDRPLTKWDRLEKRDGIYGWVYKGKKYVITGNDTISKYESQSGFKCDGIKGTPVQKMNRQDGFCNQLIVDSKGVTTGQDLVWLGVNSNVFYFPRNRFFDATLEDTGLANFKAHLNENPLEIWTRSDTEEFVPLLDEEQELLKNLETYCGVTNIMNDQDCITQIRYVADTKTFIDNEFNSLQSAIVMS